MHSEFIKGIHLMQSSKGNLAILYKYVRNTKYK